MKVLKFGGGCLKDAESIKKLPKILKNYNNEKIIIVLSAFGKITNMLENEEFENVFHFVNGIMQKLGFTENERDNIIKNPLAPSYLSIGLDHKSLWDFLPEKPEKKTNKKYHFSYPNRVCIGEYISSSIIHHYLMKFSIESILLDAGMCIQTSHWDSVKKCGLFHASKIPQNNSPFYREGYKKSNLDIDSVFLENQFLITQGFISRELVHERNVINTHSLDSQNSFLIESDRTTLGREGSDYSASLFASLFHADEVILFKDVDGIYNTDPKKDIKAKLFSRLTYDEAFKLCNGGNMVVHPKTIQHLKNHKIPLSIKNFENIQKPGTLITD